MAFVDHAMTVLLIAAAVAYVAYRARHRVLSARARRGACRPDCCE
jgi:hypothetical protein